MPHNIARHAAEEAHHATHIAVDAPAEEGNGDPPINLLGFESFELGTENFRTQSIDDASSSLNHSCLRSRSQLDISNHIREVRAARQIHAQPLRRSARRKRTRATPFRSGETGTSASWLFTQWER
ncbi:hypothetical protein [Streptomyces sp. HB132]|uniref:hypothetical protein n=1 Tax=Streptomyces sp. HB132 TaxID=767388 RepID=UPI001960ADF6|nr:hypothetical protein [Streptomyces sp. HB132]MBM7440178.1 hypothetical protein [Streptomyces sp. HB132]